MCISLMTNDIGLPFMSFLGICMFSLEKSLFKFFVHFKIGFFCCSMVGALYVFWMLEPYRIKICKYLLPFCWVSFPFLDDEPWCTTVF